MHADETRRVIVSCDGCGAPYPAVVQEDDSPIVLGGGDSGCPKCGEDAFSKLSI